MAIKHVAFLTLVFLLIGCSGTGQRLDSTTKYKSPDSETGFGTIFVARKSQVYGSGVTIFVEVNEKELGNLGTSEFLQAPAKKGVNVVKSGLAGLAGKMAIGDNLPVRSFTQESKKDRYFVVSLGFDLFSPQIRMKEVSEAQWLKAAD